MKLAAMLPWSDGVWFVDFSEIIDGDLIWHVIARAVGIRDWPDRPDRPVGETVASIWQPSPASHGGVELSAAGSR